MINGESIAKLIVIFVGFYLFQKMIKKKKREKKK